MRNTREAVQPTDYTVEIDSSGRSGNVIYKEPGVELKFWWEFTMNGAVINVPSALHWNNHCDSVHAEGAKNRKQEICERIGYETRRQKATSAELEFEDEWIVLKF